MADPIVLRVTEPSITLKVVEEGSPTVVRIVEEGSPTVVQIVVPGPPGPTGPIGGAETYTAVATVSGHRVLIFSATGVRHADPSDLAHAHRVVGVGTNAALTGGDVTVIGFGDVTEPGWSFTPGLPVFVGPSGTLTQTPPALPGAAFSIRIGAALSATTLRVCVEPPIILT